MLRVLALATLAIAAWAQGTGPSYSAAGLVHAATNLPGPLAPNTIATLYGSNLCYNTVAVAQSDIRSDTLPTKLGGVRILFENSTPAPLYYVSPTQINFLIPASRKPGEWQIQVVRDSTAGPLIPFTIAVVAPGLFQSKSSAVATHADGSAVNADARAHPGEAIVLYATGLGETTSTDPIEDGKLVSAAADLQSIRIRRFTDFSILLNGAPVDGERILWAGLAPGFAGLYQINLQLPDALDSDPDIRIALSGQLSPEGVKLAAASK